MPTIAEIIEAKRAAALAAPQAAIPPGKRAGALGLVVTKTTLDAPESRGQRTPVRGPEEDMFRALGATQGELIPMTPPGADATTRAWHEARVALEGELCVVDDPDEADVCWLALRPCRGRHATLLLHRLPWVRSRPMPPATDAEPF
jgi:hypothetical protein